MKNNLTEMVFLLDRSGSMCGLEADTIGGFNSMIEKQKKEEGQAFVTTVLFNTQHTVLHDRLPLDKIRTMTREDYVVGGGTALLDAVDHADDFALLQRLGHIDDLCGIARLHGLVEVAHGA